VVKYGEVSKGMRKLYIVGDDGVQKEYSIPRGVHINVQEGERVRSEDPLMDGPRNPHDILAVLGEKELQKYLVNEIQEVYRLQGVNINDKHLEVISRQMMRWIRIEDIGDTEFLPEEVVDKFKFREENNRVIEAGQRPAAGKPILLGITKASLSTDSFISAASFQETTRVLTEAAINGKVDYLRGLKENVIMGRLIPAGTGMEYYRRVKIAGEAHVNSVRIHSVHADTVRRHLKSQCLGQHLYTTLGGVVVRLTVVSAGGHNLSFNAAEVDDGTSVTGLHQCTTEGLSTEELPFEIHVHDEIPFLFRQIKERRHGDEFCMIHEVIHSAEGLQAGCNHCFSIGLDGNVGTIEECRPTIRLHHPNRLVTALLVAVGHHDVCA